MPTRRLSPEGGDRWTLLAGAALLGWSAVTTQLTSMRELLTFFAGNELVLGVVLGTWLLLTGLGALLGGHTDRLERPERLLIPGHLLLALIPPATLVALRAGWHLVFVRGAAIGPTATLATCFAVLLPYCLLSGYLFSVYSVVLRGVDGARSVGDVYIAEGVGSMIGGALFSLLLVQVFGHYHILVLQGLLNSALVLWFSHRARKLGTTLVALASAIALVFSWAGVDMEILSLQARYVDQAVLFAGNSPYGSVVLTELEGQRTLYENGVPVLATQDPGDREEAIHFAMAQYPEARRVLLISGGIGGAVLEVLKYPGARVDYVELDPLLLEVGQRLESTDTSGDRLDVITGDGRRFLRSSDRRYDVIISRVPDPTTCQVTRYYTLEFFQDVRRHLNPDGVFALALGHYENFLSDELADMLSIGYQTLHTVFPHILMVPGRKVYFLASSRPLNARIGEALEGAGVRLSFLTPGYLRDVLDPGRRQDLERAVEESVPFNTDLNPALYYYHLRYWMSRFGDRLLVPLVLLALLVVFYLARIRAVSFAVFSAGFTASALEVVILLVFQAWYGSVYQQLGWLVTTFMAGMVVGGWFGQRMPRLWKRRGIVGLAGELAVFAAATPIVFRGMEALDAGGGWGQWVLAALIFLLAMLVGLQFVIAARVDFDRGGATAARTYSADLVGACVGAFLVSGFLIPVVGVDTVCLATGGLNIVAAVVLLARRG